MWGRLYRKSFLDKYNIRFLDGFQTDNFPYAIKLLSHLNNFYIISKEISPNSGYWRRLITIVGVLTDTVLYKNLEIPATFDDLFNYLKANGTLNKIKIPFYVLFTLCFPTHIDQPRYYLEFKKLVEKMEETIKNNPSLYDKNEVNL